MAQLEAFIQAWQSNAPYIEARTSGSTGTPKSIHLLKNDMRSSALATNAFFGIRNNSVLGLPLSLDYIAGKMMAVRALLAGCRLLQMPVSNRVELCERVSLLSVVPSQIECILDKAHLIDNLLIGGAPLDDDMRRRVLDAGIEAYIGYGMTETCSHVALRSLRSERPLYKAMPGIEFSTDQRGCLVIHSDRFSWKSLTTNDVVNLHSPCEFEWLGRADNVINSGGVKLHPEQIENEIRLQLPSLPQFYLTSAPDEILGERLVMVAECSEEDAPAILEQVKTLALSRYGHPKQIIATQQLPRTQNGKLKREKIEG